MRNRIDNLNSHLFTQLDKLENAAYYWKPSGSRRGDLVKAAALIIAEIERLDRLSSREKDKLE